MPARFGMTIGTGLPGQIVVINPYIIPVTCIVAGITLGTGWRMSGRFVMTRTARLGYLAVTELH